MRTRARIIAAAIGAAAFAALAYSCTTTGPGSSDTSSKYKQTWPKRYDATTCHDYLGTMTVRQRWVAAADMLTSSRKVDGATRVPLDFQVDRFQTDIATACEPIATATIADIAVAVYVAGSSYHP